MQKNKAIRIVIDTNLWISFIISKKLHLLDTIIFEQNVEILFSNELFLEIETTIKKPKLKKYFETDELEKMIFSFKDFIVIVDVVSEVKLCRDDKDNFLLSLYKDGKADYLITGDKDLLVLEKVNKTKIVTIANFLEIFL
jgi:uncharacterized protein